MDVWTRKLIADGIVRERQETAARAREAHLAMAAGRRAAPRSNSERFALSIPRLNGFIGIRRPGRI